MTEFHRSLVVVDSSVDTTHHTLIITEEENGETGNAIDGNEKSTLLEPMADVVARDSIHGGGNARLPSC